MASKSFFEFFGRLFSRKQIREINTHLSAAGVELSAEAFAGYFLLNVVVLILIATVAVFFVPSLNAQVTGFFKFFDPLMGNIGIGIMVFLAIVFVVYFLIFSLVSAILVFKTEARRKAIETALPDFLMLVAANIKAGMTLDQAMWYAAKPEFGLLSIEVKKIIKQAFSGKSLYDALDELSMRFDSKIFQRTVSLVKQASSTGGEIAEVLERTSQDARDSYIIKKEISSSLIIYEIFVLFAACIGTPFLFAVSTKLISVLEKAATYLPEARPSANQFSFIQSISPVVTSEQFFWFSVATLVITSVFSSFIVGIIRGGSKTEGLKFIPFVLAIAYIVLIFVNTLLDQFFTTLT